MRLDQKDITLIAVGLAVVALVCLIAHLQTDDAGKSQPRYEGELALASLSGALVIDALDTGDHYFHPNHAVAGQQQVFTAHRYPRVSGGNITALIHNGFDQMRKPAPQDTDWFLKPPAEEAW